jgi:DNA replication licensing factor MCM7
VDEALRLMEASKESLRDDDGEGDGAGGADADRSDTSRIYRIVKDMAKAVASVAGGAGAGAGGRRATRRRPQRLGRGPDGERDYADEEDGEEEGGALDVLSMVDIRARVLRAGYTETQLMTTIQEVSEGRRPFGRLHCSFFI